MITQIEGEALALRLEARADEVAQKHSADPNCAFINDFVIFDNGGRLTEKHNAALFRTIFLQGMVEGIRVFDRFCDENEPRTISDGPTASVGTADPAENECKVD